MITIPRLFCRGASSCVPALLAIVFAGLANAVIIPEQVGYLGHSSDFVATAGNLAFITVGDELQVVNVASTTAPALVGSCSLLDENLVTVGKIAGIELGGNNVYILRDNGSVALQVVDVLDPANPVLRGSFSPPASTSGNDQATSGRSMTAEGNIVYLGVSTHGVYVISCADPNNPVQIGNYDISPGVNANTPTVLDIASSGTRVFVKTGNPDTVLSLDFSTPGSPLELGFNNTVGSQDRIEATSSLVLLYSPNLVILNAGLPATLPQLSAPGITAESLAVSGSTAYISNIIQMQVVDLTNPSSPSVSGSIVLGGLSVVGKGDIAATSSAALLTNGAGLRVVNVTNPAVPALDSTYNKSFLGEPIQAPVFANGRMYMLTDTSEFNGSGRSTITALLPVSGGTPILLGSLLLPVADRPNDLAASGDTLYAVTDTKIFIVDATTPGSMAVIGSTTHPGALEFGKTVTVSGTRAYAGGPDGVNIYDVSDPGSIGTLGQYVGVFPNIVEVFDVKLDGTFLYCAGGVAGLQILNVSNAALPLLAALENLGGADIREVQLSGTECYVRGSETIYTFDVTSPTAPGLLGEIALPTTSSLGECGGCNKNYNGSFIVTGATGYVAAGTDGLHVVNYTDSSDPFVADTWDTAWLNYVALDANNLYLAEDVFEYPTPGEAGLRVVTPLVIEDDDEDPTIGVIYSTPTFPEDGEYCTLTAPAGSNYQWRRNGLDMADVSPRVTGTNARVLVFDPIELADEATYTCVYDDGSKVMVETLPFHLNVYDANSVPASSDSALLMALIAIAGAGFFATRTLKRQRN